MIIGVDAGALSITDERLKVGVWRVTYNLLQELLKLDPTNEYRLYSFGRGVGEMREIRKIGVGRVSEIRLPALGWSSHWLPLHLRLFPVDVFLGLAQALPVPPSYAIGFIYDLGFLFHPEAYEGSAERLRKQTADLVKRANHIVTISEASKKDILSYYGTKQDRVTVAYPGVDERFIGEIPRLSASWRIAWDDKNPYFLFVGSLTKTKDVPLAIEAFAQFLKRTKKTYDFLLIGGDYWSDPAIDASINRLQLNNRVKKLGFVPDAQLLGYYRGATAFVTTALHEGFCLPAAEAMACGTPVVALDRGAIKEVVGKSGIIVNVNKQRSIMSTKLADALSEITKPEIRKKLAIQAVARARIFRWETFAKNVLTLVQTNDR